MTRFGRTSKLVAAVLGGALVLSACSSDEDDPTDGEGNSESAGPSGTVTLAWGQPFDSYNDTTAGGNTFANGIATHSVTTGFWMYAGEDGQVTPNEEFGTYEQTSDDPLTVEYHINEDAVWSDGTPIDCDDVMLWWTSQSGAFDGLFSAAGTQGIEDTEMPDCQPGDKDFTLRYNDTFTDWESFGPGHGNNTMMPAHVVAEQGGFDSPEAFLQALRGDDPQQLQEAADFFNEGWLMDGEMPDPSLIPSSGPFVITDYVENQSVTLSYNEKYWGTPPNAETVVIRLIPEEEQVQALQNGEVDIIAPQPTVDMAEQINAAQGIESEVAEQYSYEHLDFNFNAGPFADSLELRRAFSLCVPRETIVQNLIRPVVPDAEVKDVRNVAPWDPGYGVAQDAVQEQVDEYGQQDIDRARQILEQENAVGTTVNLATLDLQRRNDTGNLIVDACNEAGFNVEFSSTADFFDTNGALGQNRFDVAMFAWIGSAERSNWNSTYRTVRACTVAGKGNNNGCYSSPEMDRLLDQVLVAEDEEQAAALSAEIEQLAWEDMVTIPLFQHPAIYAWGENVQNVVPNPSLTGVAWNMSEWSKGV
jgi:peptide/nickel transport system substrate-binding protein